MKPKPNKRIDKLLGELGLHPHSSKVARYRRERTPKGCERTAQVPTSKPSLASSFLRPLSCGLRRGRATFAACKAWHLTSAKNIGSSKSSGTTRNAGRNRRNHHQSPSSDES
jgi:hypothetical protein